MRIETEVDRLLITITVDRHQHVGLAVAGQPRVMHFARVEEAIDAVAEFVRSHGPPASSSG
ncbi:MAG TPA: hypothetical protein VES03_04480 [Motilibacterales bacterium]|jgi:stress response protein SCP2|nr:hypothetical protein [Motilibacterales bacterium]